jgi:hypothetical protein
MAPTIKIWRDQLAGYGTGYDDYSTTIQLPNRE